MMLFEGAIKAQETRRKYKFYLSKFLEFAKITQPDGLLQLKDRHLETIVEDYLLYLRKRVSPNSISVMFAPIELFFTMNDKNLNFKRIRKMFPQTVKKAGSEAWTTDDVQHILEVTKTIRNKALILFLASTGCRIGAISGLKIKHVENMPHGCKSILFYAGEKEEYYAFLTPEASESLDRYLEKRKADREYIDSNSPLFRQVYQVGSLKPIPISKSSIERIVRQSLKQANISRERLGNRYTIQTIHGFRKRFATIIKLNKDLSHSTTEALLGHKSGLDAIYYRPNTKKQLFEEFRKAIQDLTIDDSERNKLKIEKLEKEITAHEFRDDKIEKLQEKFELDHKLIVEFARMLESLGIQLTNDDDTPYLTDEERAANNKVESTL